MITRTLRAMAADLQKRWGGQSDDDDDEFDTRKPKRHPKPESNSMSKSYEIRIVNNGFIVTAGRRMEAMERGEETVFATPADLAAFFKAEKASIDTVNEARAIVKAAQ